MMRTMVLLAVMGGLVAGCAARADVIEGPGSSGLVPKSVAILYFKSDMTDVAARAEDGCLAGILRLGLRGIERQRVENLLQEKTLSRSGEMTAHAYQELGRMLGVDAFVIGSVGTQWGRARTVSVRLVSAVTGEAARMANFQDTVGDGYDHGMHACEAVVRGSG